MCPLRTDYATLINVKWDQDEASSRIIETCMTRLTLAAVCSEDHVVLVDLGKSDMEYSIVWSMVLKEEEEFQEQREAFIHEQCKKDGIAKGQRMFESDWLKKVTD
jgi:hypothetical protein